ncbi:MAG: peptide chain release factor family protein [Planctomycetota bacterium]|jgi:hypothetical protein
MDCSTRDRLLTCDDAALMGECKMDVFRVHTAVRLRHAESGIAAEATESRSQNDNRQKALRRLRMKIACDVRCRPADQPPAVVSECMFVPRGGPATGRRRLEVGRKDGRFWSVAAYLLDVLEISEGQLRQAADRIGISTGNLTALLTDDRHLLTTAQSIRKRYGHKPLK